MGEDLHCSSYQTAHALAKNKRLTTDDRRSWRRLNSDISTAFGCLAGSISHTLPDPASRGSAPPRKSVSPTSVTPLPLISPSCIRLDSKPTLNDGLGGWAGIHKGKQHSIGASKSFCCRSRGLTAAVRRTWPTSSRSTRRPSPTHCICSDRARSMATDQPRPVHLRALNPSLCTRPSPDPTSHSHAASSLQSSPSRPTTSTSSSASSKRPSASILVL